MIEICNCDCLPIIPLEELGHCLACQQQGCEEDDEAMSELSGRDSLDSNRSSGGF